MKQYIAILIVLLLAAPTSAAIWDPIDIGKDMISGGIDDAVKNFADGIMEFLIGEEATNTTGNETIPEEPKTITDHIISFSSWTVTPFEYPSIQEMLGLSLAIAAGVMIGYIFLGAANATIATAAPEQYRTLRSVAGAEGSDSSLGNYGHNVITGLLAMSFMALFIWIILLLSETLKLMIMGSIADSISPSMESVSVLYLMMALMWLCVAIFFGISNVVICITAGISFLLGALYASDRTRHLTTWWLDYFFSLMMMQVWVVLIAAIVAGVMMDVKTGEYGYMMTPGMEASVYIGMILFLVGMCAAFIIGKVLLFKLVKTVIKVVL